MLDKLKGIFTVLKKGQAVADAAGTKNRAAIVMAVTAFLVALKGFLPAFGIDVTVADAQIEQGVYGAAAFFGLLYSLWANFASSEKVGL